jgi:hypothetical protein
VIDHRIRKALAAAREAATVDRDAFAALRRTDVVRWRRPALGANPRTAPWHPERAGREARWLDDERDRHTDIVVGFAATTVWCSRRSAGRGTVRWGSLRGELAALRRRATRRRVVPRHPSPTSRARGSARATCWFCTSHPADRRIAVLVLRRSSL